MRVFLSVGEPSGDVHGANLIRALQTFDPNVECVGFGGDRMAEAGCDHLFNLCNHAVMGFSEVLASVPRLIGLVRKADHYFRRHRPDAVVLIDYPGFNWWIARRAHRHRIPVFYFVPPQLWAWAGWRIKKVKQFVDHTLCALPFEAEWFRERGVDAEYVGHPFFDELPRQQLDMEMMDSQRRKGGTIVGLLPGSRTQEVEMNFLSQIRAAERIHAERPDTRFLAACFKESHQQAIDRLCREFPHVPVETFVGKTPEIIELSKTCISVSGSVSLELLYRNKPTVIVYRLSNWTALLIWPLVNIRFITLVNILAKKRLFPEYLTIDCEAPGMARETLRWLNDERHFNETCRELSALRAKGAAPGACGRAAERIVEVVTGKDFTAARPLAA